jgi:hypothetical protein
VYRFVGELDFLNFGRIGLRFLGARFLELLISVP